MCNLISFVYIAQVLLLQAALLHTSTQAPHFYVVSDLINAIFTSIINIVWSVLYLIG